MRTLILMLALCASACEVKEPTKPALPEAPVVEFTSTRVAPDGTILLITDQSNGCQYLVVETGVTPRVDRYGYPVCGGLR